ncbi:unnamed protein product [Notodromas monacha]|uniref:Sulfotransferase domain-containing protein n=1 Tax=Notodromas monacha TaxID=399045 RepID=A0A7R9BKJ8_9CRUS|nr:unnamed protein product [Notodromas monacha]CAG0917182.1 unnamed protein product [Notodromas monacha]
MKKHPGTNAWIVVIVIVTICLAFFRISSVRYYQNHEQFSHEGDAFRIREDALASNDVGAHPRTLAKFTEEPLRANQNYVEHPDENYAEQILFYQKAILLDATAEIDTVAPLERSPELDGTPVRNVILTTWRSGSTFLGDLMISHPRTFYHYEPLLPFGINRVRADWKGGSLTTNATVALKLLKDLMMCRYANLSDYLEFGKSHIYLMTHNEALWPRCRRLVPDSELSGYAQDIRNDADPASFVDRTSRVPLYDNSLCFDARFLSRLCAMFPVQAIKTVRLGLAAAEPLISDPRMNLRVLLLVRDPRGTMESRRHRDWCPGNADCDDPVKLCGDLIADYHAAEVLTRKYPGKVRVERYEDFSTDLENSVPKIFKFLRLAFTNTTKNFLESHTKVNVGGVSSTFRDSKRAPFEWRYKLSLEEIDLVQRPCRKAMKLWGYKLMNTTEIRTKLNMDEFNPLVNGYKLPFV